MKAFIEGAWCETSELSPREGPPLVLDLSSWSQGYPLDSLGPPAQSVYPITDESEDDVRAGHRTDPSADIHYSEDCVNVSSKYAKLKIAP